MGKPVSSYPFSVEIMTSSYTSELFMRNILGGLKYFSRSIEVVPGVSKNTLVFASPVTDPSKQVVGAIVAIIDVNSLGDRLAEIGAGDQKISLVDGNGRWIVNQDIRLLGERVSETDTANLIWTRETGAEIGYDSKGKFSMFRSSKSTDIGWTVVVSEAVFSILDVSRSGLVLVLVMLSITILIVSFSFVFANDKSSISNR
jgi:hypothetical protein